MATTKEKIEALAERVDKIRNTVAFLIEQIRIMGWFKMPDEYVLYLPLADGQVFGLSRYPTKYRGTGSCRLLRIAEDAPKTVEYQGFEFPLCKPGDQMSVPEGPLTEFMERMGYVEHSPEGTITRVQSI